MPRNTRWLHVLTALILVLVAFGARQPNAHAQNIYVVTTTADTDGNVCGTPCSLRQAIKNADSAGGGTIVFDIPTNDPGFYSFLDGTSLISTWTITVTDQLPPLTGNITIDAATEQGAANNPNGPEIFIDGSNLATSGTISGLILQGDNNKVIGLGIINFKNPGPSSAKRGYGIEIRGSNNELKGNWIGIDVHRNAAGQRSSGIYITGSNNTIGGANNSDKQYNIIADNGENGIELAAGSSENIIRGNYIGILSNGVTAHPNGGHGIYINASNNNTIGSDEHTNTISFANYISGNVGAGIYIENAANNKIYGNVIGLNTPSNAAVPNQDNGIYIYTPINNTAIGNVIGGIGGAAHNIISGNVGAGIRLEGPGVRETRIVNNYIGTNNNRDASIGNSSYGILVTNGASNNFIGSSDANRGNLIAGNGADGIYITGGNYASGARNNQVFGNTIGIGYSGSNPIALPNTGAGIVLSNKVYETSIGGEDENERNLIANHTQNGITIDATSGAVLTTTLYLNRIYQNAGHGIEIKGAKTTNIYGTDVLSNTLTGISLDNVYDTFISGTEPDQPSLVTGNTSHGIQATNAHTLTLRYISTAPSNYSAKGNGGDGVHISNSEWVELLRSTIDNNKGTGATFDSVQHFAIEGEIVPGSDGNPDTENRGFFRLNEKEGILLTNVVSGTIIANQVTSNWDDGINVTGGSDDVNIYRNIIRSNGPQNDDSSFDCSANQRSNDGQGVAIRGGSKHITVMRSLFGENCGLGILRDPNDTSAGSANEGIQPPVLIGFNNERQLRGQIILTGPGACEECTVEIFRSRDTLTTPDGEGGHKQNSGVDTITSFDEEGNFSFTLDRVPMQILATATDKYGNTSEFSTYTITRTVDIEAAQTVTDAYPSQEIVFSQTATNTGTFDDTFELSFNSKVGLNSSNVRFSPGNSLSLLAGETKPFTVTVTLPSGADPRVAAGTIEELGIRIASTSYVTASDVLTHTISVTSSVAIAVTPTNTTGEVQAGQTFTHHFTVTNNGNIQATLNLSYTTTPAWVTEMDVANQTLTLAPGASRQVAIAVTAPEGSLAGNQAVTTLSIDVVGNPSQNKSATATTRVVVTPKAAFYNDENGEASPGGTAVYRHTIENLSNGTVNLQLRLSFSTLDSTVRFVSETPGVTIDANGNFSLNPGQSLNVQVEVTLPSNAPPGGMDTITIQLIDTSTGNVIGSVQDRTRVLGSTGGASNTIYLPFVAN